MLLVERARRVDLVPGYRWTYFIATKVERRVALGEVEPLIRCALDRGKCRRIWCRDSADSDTAERDGDEEKSTANTHQVPPKFGAATRVPRIEPMASVLHIRQSARAAEALSS